MRTLESSCCKMWQKSPNQETGFGNRGLLKVLSDKKLKLGVHNWCSFRNNLVSFRTFRLPLFPKPVSWLGLFFAASCINIALIASLLLMNSLVEKCNDKFREIGEYTIIICHSLRKNFRFDPYLVAEKLISLFILW